MILARNTETLVRGLLAVAVTLAVAAYLLNSSLLAKESALVFILDIFFIWFFRDPERTAQGPEDVILSPADGKVVDIRDNTACIFMNIHNVHVNRAPVSGKIVKMKHKDGGYLPAFFKDSHRNERNLICIESDYGLVRMVQIAGTVTRRIDTYFNVGDSVVRGERIGMIRFGSRVDITPPNGYTLIVNKGDRVKAAVSAIAIRNTTGQNDSGHHAGG
ncbi:MAG: phosphatidylserine decarboxylase [Methanosarcinales archaeon]|nr:phosphatidylserine decarboxylase [Methanosarcinales archaeon]